MIQRKCVLFLLASLSENKLADRIPATIKLDDYTAYVVNGQNICSMILPDDGSIENDDNIVSFYVNIFHKHNRAVVYKFRNRLTDQSHLAFHNIRAIIPNEKESRQTRIILTVRVLRLTTMDRVHNHKENSS